jgi:hypothetical protein
MTNPFRITPQTVQWSAFSLVFIPVFDAMVTLNEVPLAIYLEYWPYRLLNLGVWLGLSVGLLYGLNLVRILFVTLFVISVASELYRWHHLGLPSTNLVARAVSLGLPCVALILCFMPSANRYFRRSASDGTPAPGSTAEAAMAKTEARRTRPWINLPLVLLALGGAFVLVRMIGPDQRTRDVQDLAIGNNLRMLRLAERQFQIEEPGRVAKLSDLVGDQTKSIPKLNYVAGEKYPEDFPYGVEPVATLPNGLVVSLNAAGVAVRGPAKKRVQAVAAVATPPASNSKAPSPVVTPQVVRSIVGRWVARMEDPTGELTLTLDATGRLHVEAQAMNDEKLETSKTEGTYTFEGSRLTTTTSEVGGTGKKETTTFDVSWEGEWLVLEPGDGTKVRFVQQPPK